METIVPIKNLHEHIVSLAKQNPKKTALISCDMEGNISREITYEELLRQVESAADYLHKLSLKGGDRVALAFNNSVELLVISWAAWSVGIVTVPLDIKRDTSELRQYKIKLSNAKLLIAQEGISENFDTEYIQVVKVTNFFGLSVDLPAESLLKAGALAQTGFPKSSNTKIEWKLGLPAVASAKAGLSHEALILFTSGTTAHPKGAKLTLENLIVNAQSIQEWLRIKEEDRFFVNLPLHHINSTTFCLATLLAGGSIAIPQAYSNSRFWQQAAAMKATITSIVQSILFDQLGRGDEFARVKNKLKLNRIQIGSAPVVVQTLQEFRKKFHIPLYQGYGQTETALRVTGVPMGLPQSLYEGLIEKNSIGSPMSWADVQIADEKGKVLGENEEGELVVKGLAVMEGYLGDEPAFRNSYFLTGDIGFYKRINGNKFFFLKGRKKEIIIKGGINISPVAVENNLKNISDDIAQAYVVGIPDARYGEEVGAVICWKKDIDEENAKRRLKCALVFGTPFISAYETPKYIASILPENLPTTSTGKVQRTILKNKVQFAKFEPIETLVKTDRYKFLILNPQSPYASASNELYNNSWQPLTVDKREYKKNISKQFIIIAVDEQNGSTHSTNSGRAGLTINKIAGQIAFIRTNFGDKELLHTTYDELLTPEVSHSQGKAFVCVSICSSGFKPKPIPSVAQIPDAEEVRKYLLAGDDPVYNFHQKLKGGQLEGAKLIGVIPNGRPEDKSSLGYTMLLKYPAPPENVGITNEALISNQLIEAVLLIARDIGIKEVYAYSRPGGLAAYVSKQEKENI